MPKRQSGAPAAGTGAPCCLTSTARGISTPFLSRRNRNLPHFLPRSKKPKSLCFSSRVSVPRLDSA
jgi:hypothetical protein